MPRLETVGLPADPAIDKVFTKVRILHPTAVPKLTQYLYATELTRTERALLEFEARLIAQRFILTPALHLSQRGPTRELQQLGTTFLGTFNDQVVYSVVDDTSRPHRLETRPDTSHFLDISEDPGISFVVHPKKKAGLLLSTPDLIQMMIDKPIEAMGATIEAFSYIQDVVNGMTDVGNFQIRAQAYRSTFFMHVASQNPDYQLRPDDQGLIQKYPQGIESMPRKIRYNPRQLRVVVRSGR